MIVWFKFLIVWSVLDPAFRQLPLGPGLCMDINFFRKFPKISLVWKSIPSQLARENKKFLYKVVKEGARAREYEDAPQWLVDARLVHKVYRSSAPGLPVAAYDDLSAFNLKSSPAAGARQIRPMKSIF